MTSSFAIFLLAHWHSRTLEVSLLEQRVVLVRHHVGLGLCHEIHCHHHNTQEGCTPEIKGHVPTHLHEFGQQANQGDIECPGQRQTHEDTVNISGCLRPGADT